MPCLMPHNRLLLTLKLHLMLLLPFGLMMRVSERGIQMGKGGQVKMLIHLHFGLRQL